MLLNPIMRAAGDGGAAPTGGAPVVEMSNDFAPVWDGGNPAQPTFQDAGEADAPAAAQAATADTGAVADQAAAADAAVAAAVTPEEYAAAVAERDQFKAWQSVIERLQGEGYADPAAVERALEAQNAQRAEAAEQAHWDQRFGQLQADIDAGKITPEGAQAQFDYEMGRHQVAQQLARLQPIENQYTEWQAGQQLEAAKSQYPNMDPDYVRQLHQATGKPIAELAKASHDYRAKIEADALARYQGQKAAAAAAPAPEGATGTPPPVSGASGQKPWNQSFRDLFGIGQAG